MFKIQLICLYMIICCTAAYEIKLENNGPIVRGASIHFKVTVYDDGGYQPTTNKIQFQWSDGAIPRHTKESGFVQNGTDSWDITYNASTYPTGSYVVQVIVRQCNWIGYCYDAGSARTLYYITSNFNGKLITVQKNQTMTNNYVSTKDETEFAVKLKKTDTNFIHTAPSVRTYWFVDCIYYGITSDMKFGINFTSPDQIHTVEALVMADFSPPVPSTTTTTTTTTTPKPSTTTPKPTTTTTTTSTSKTTVTTKQTTTQPKTSKIVKRSSNDDYTPQESNLKIWNNGILKPYNKSFPFICNSSYISRDPNKIYGYFYKSIQTKDPLFNTTVTGNNWLQPGDLLSLKVQCSGSKNFKYCVEFKRGEYNITGNETCEFQQQTDTCEFSIKRYLSYPKNTIIIIIENDVSKEVKLVTVNIYKVKKEGQLSVIVVPVAFSLVAVVLIVFGIAYYFQNRNRFIIEVADFNFGQQYADLEYKTFRERLRDSITNAFTRTPASNSGSEVPVWPPGRKYGSMT